MKKREPFRLSHFADHQTKSGSIKGSHCHVMILIDISLLAPHKGSIVFCVDLPDFFFTVYIILINSLDASAPTIITAGAELAVDAAGSPQRLVNDLNTFLPRGVFDQYGFHDNHPLYISQKQCFRFYYNLHKNALSMHRLIS